MSMITFSSWLPAILLIICVNDTGTFTDGL